VVEAGDRDVALFLVKKAEKACRAKNYEEAAETFKRAREEFTPLPEAAFGMGQAFEKLERNAEAIAAYRLCAEEVGAAEKPPAVWKALARRANAALTRIRRRFAELDRLNRAFIDDCMKFGIAHLKTDPRWAQTAFETVLKLDPAHTRARRCLDKFKKAEAWGTPLIRGDDLEGWSPGIRPPWTCAKGVVAADVGNPGHINWVKDVELTGRYEVRVRMRIVRSGAQWTFGLLIGNGKDYWHNFFVKDGHSIRFDEYDGGTIRPRKDAILRDFDPQKWNTLRLAVDRGSLGVFMNEKKLFEYDADERDAFDGNVALFGQSGLFEYKELEVRR
jgi:tetratricopeptide (TPR) repeat protein